MTKITKNIIMMVIGDLALLVIMHKGQNIFFFYFLTGLPLLINQMYEKENSKDGCESLFGGAVAEGGVTKAGLDVGESTTKISIDIVCKILTF